jgi:putative ABC transport system permease protein
MGLVGFIFMLLYAHYEKSYEKWIPGHDNIYRLDQREDASHPIIENTPGILAATVEKEVPGVQSATALQKFNFGTPFYSSTNNSYTFKKFYGVDSSFLKIFPLHLKYGTLHDFYQPAQILLSDKVSKAFFGDINPVGKTISMGYHTGVDFNIAGVFVMPGPTHLDLEAISWYPENMVPKEWTTNSFIPFVTYIKLDKDADAPVIAGKIKSLYQKNETKENPSLSVMLEPISGIHLSSVITGDANLKFLWIIVLLSGLMLLIACMNFINLIIAKSSARSKEFAIKKVLGTSRGALIHQFLSETFLQALVAFMLALALLFLLMPYLKNMMSIKENLLLSLTAPSVIVALLTLIMLITFATGLYPAIIISRKKVTTFLKGSSSSEKGRSTFRSFLLVIQFTMATAFIISLLFINKQVEYMKNKDLGFKPEQVLAVSTFSTFPTPASFDHDKIPLLEIAGIKSATVTSDVPGNKIQSSVNLKVDGEPYVLKSMAVDYDYFKTLSIPMLEGRDFSKGHIADSSRSLILNQSAVERMQLKAPLGKRVQLNDSTFYTIIGVCKDYFNNGFTENIPPIAFTMTNPVGKTSRSEILLKVSSANMSGAITKLKELWTTLSPMDPQLRYSFLDEDYGKLFEESEKLSNLFKMVSYLSLFISLIGLFALSGFLISQRKKELSIRKVIGASAFDIFLLVNKSFVKLIFIATLLGDVLSYFFTSNWLKNYAYQITLNMVIYLVVFFVILLLTVLTITAQSYKTIKENPVKNLAAE